MRKGRPSRGLGCECAPHRTQPAASRLGRAGWCCVGSLTSIKNNSDTDYFVNAGGARIQRRPSDCEIISRLKNGVGARHLHEVQHKTGLVLRAPSPSGAGTPMYMYKGGFAKHSK